MARLVGVSEQVERTVPSVPAAASQASARRRKYRSYMSGLRRGDGWVRNEYDQLLLEAITRLGVMSIRQAHRHIYPHLAFKTVRLRIGMMVQAGLLERIDTIGWAGTIVWPTASGRRAGTNDEPSPLRAMEAPSESTMLHRLLVSEYALSYIASGVSIITEREARVYETGDAIFNVEDRAAFLQSLGVVRSNGQTRGVVPSPDVVADKQVERWMTLPVHDGQTRVRIPDFLVVTKDGELRAVEVEPTAKQPSRLRSILKAYRDVSLRHNPVIGGTNTTLGEAGRLPGQFNSVRWLATPPVHQQLRGDESGVNKITGKRDIGLVREVWNDSVNTHLFFQKEETWNLNKMGWPISVAPLDVSFDSGMEYAVEQRSLPVTYRCSLQEWHRWRKLWKQDMEGEDQPAPFTQWIRFPGVLESCREHSR